VATNDLPRAGGHPFYERLNATLDANGFDEFVGAQCASFYATIAWRAARATRLPGAGPQSDATRAFDDLAHASPDRSGDDRAVFTWIPQVLATADLVKGKAIGIDTTTLEANGLRSIVRRDSGETYQEFLTRLAQASGVATPRADLARHAANPISVATHC
jgi:transposase